MTEADQRCGTVAIAGRPNVGKSTLLNRVLGEKLSITSRKPQTTRRNLIGIDTEGSCQAIYVDTPGLHRRVKRAINRSMVGNAKAALGDADLIVLVLDRDRLTDGDEWVMRQVEWAAKPAFAIINKIDLLSDKTRLLPAMERLGASGLFAEIMPVSALGGEGVAEFRALVFQSLPAGPHLFAADQLTDESERFLASEMIREKLMRRLGDELPHRTAVVVESFDESSAVVDLRAQILVERASQKRIVIGKDGEKLKSIGREARLDIERMLGRRVMLHLWVKVRSGWSDSPAALRDLGLDGGRPGS